MRFVDVNSTSSPMSARCLRASTQEIRKVGGTILNLAPTAADPVITERRLRSNRLPADMRLQSNGIVLSELVFLGCDHELPNRDVPASFS